MKINEKMKQEERKIIEGGSRKKEKETGIWKR